MTFSVAQMAFITKLYIIILGGTEINLTYKLVSFESDRSR